MTENFTTTLLHYGIKRRSGRYPWGSGSQAFQSNKSFLAEVSKLRKAGLSDAEIAKGMGMRTVDLKAASSIARNEIRAARIAQAQQMKDAGNSVTAIGEAMGINESSVRSLLSDQVQANTAIQANTVDSLKRSLSEQGSMDIGLGAENHLGVSNTRLKNAVAQLEMEGYETGTVNIVTALGNKTTTKVVFDPEQTSWQELASNPEQIGTAFEWSEDGGRSWTSQKPPVSIDSKRIDVRYAEDGGTDADGVIYMRRGVDDLTLGKSNYAQVRIAVDDTHYLKGMAMYSDDMPDGVDIVFNTNKSDTGNKLDAMKSVKNDPDGPPVAADDAFGAVTRQIDYRGSDGKMHQSPLNIVNEEGTWDTWSNSLSTQMLSKQPEGLARDQLQKRFDARVAEFEEINSLTNPTVKKHLLDSFADGADADAVELKAAALPGQATRVILPANKMKPTEIYAPGLEDGTPVALVRYPHGGTFEIPELVVNNRQPDTKALLGNARDAVGIHSSVANRLSGADFDGDTVLVLPNRDGKIKSRPSLEGLRDFDPQTAYPGYDGMKTMGGKTYDAKARKAIQKAGDSGKSMTQMEMGKVSNLITDMTIQGAPDADIARAVRHSMVVIDAEKHSLNYKQSAIDNGITALKTEYQGKADAGASTLISRASAKERIPERSATVRVDPDTGRRIFTETGRTYRDKKGKVVTATEKAARLSLTDDAFTLSSGTAMETIYASHSNRMKDLANRARKASLLTETLKRSPSARETYRAEVDSLDAKLDIALRNAPLERKAQAISGSIVRLKRSANPNMTPEETKKVTSRALKESRLRVGASKERIRITPREWEAIQARAISPTKLSEILKNTDLDIIKEYATPRSSSGVSATAVARARSMMRSGYTQAEVAQALGISVGSLSKAIYED